jgi:hypothetical protein
MDKPPSKSEITEANELCCAIGHVIVQWGFVEHNLNICVSTIWHNFGGNKIAKTIEIDKFQRRQIVFLRDCFKMLDSLSPFKDEGIPLLNRTATLLNERDDIIHSTYAGLWDDSFKFYQFSFKEQMIYIRKLKRNINSVLETRKKIQGLATDLGHFGLRLSGK